MFLERVVRRLHRGLEFSRVLGPRVFSVQLARLFNGKEIDVNLRGVGPVRLRPRASDLTTFRHVFVEGQYDISKTAQGRKIRKIYDSLIRENITPIIVDCGANVGAASLWFAVAFPQAKIFALEPEGENARICRHNLANRPQISMLEAAVVGHRGSVEIVSMRHAQGMRTKRLEGGAAVAGLTVSDVVNMVDGQKSLLIVKVDIEGFEADLFAENIEWVDAAAAIYIEPHDWMMPGEGTSDSMQKVLFDRGFELLISGENLVFVRKDDQARPWSLN